MYQHLEREFFQRVNQLKRQRRRRLQTQIGIFILIAGLVAGLIVFYHQGFILNHASMLGILAVVLFFVFLISRLKGQADNTLLVSFKNFVEGLRTQYPRIKFKYVLGLSLLLMALVAQQPPFLITMRIGHVATSLIHRPQPPVANSPWSWQDYQTIHPAVINMPPQAETSIKSVAQYIAQQEPDPYLRVKALHDYVVSRVEYDLDVLQTGVRPSQEAGTVFQTHKAVCEGYAKLFQALGRAMNMDVVYMTGRVRQDLAPIDVIPLNLRLQTSGYDWTLHAWNVVKVAGNWQLVDTTWDDVSDQSHTSYSADYLMPPPEAMIVSHFPHQSNWQLLSQPESYRTFEQQPILSPQFFADGLTLIAPDQYEVKAHQSVSIQLQAPPGYQKRIGAVTMKAKVSEFSLWQGSTELDQVRGCDTQQEKTGEIQISCQLETLGNYQVFLLTEDQTVQPIGQLKVRAI